MTPRYERPMTIEEMKQVRDEDIDFSDIPEANAVFWAEAELRADLEKGLADVAAGRMHDLDIKLIEELGRDRLAAKAAPTRTDE